MVSEKLWLMDGSMENRNIVNYTILPATAFKISLIWENVWTISTNEPQPCGCLKLSEKFLILYICRVNQCLYLSDIWTKKWSEKLYNNFYENYFIPRWFMNCRQFQLHSSQRWTDMADNLPKMKGLLLTTQYYEWYTGNLECTLIYRRSLSLILNIF